MLIMRTSYILKVVAMKLCFTQLFVPALICVLSAGAFGADNTGELKNVNKSNTNKSATTSMDVYDLSLAELGQVQISIATGNSTPLNKAPATASVIYAAQIEAMGARTLDDILETVPGMHISLSSLSRLDSVQSVRGIHTGFNPQVLLMMNGVPVQDSVNGGRPILFRLPVASIERVEVIRGPGSAIYGADAYAGVVNVITKDSNSIKTTQLMARSGSFGSHELSLQTAGNWNGIGIAFTSAYQETDGDPDRRVSADLQSSLDALLGTNASLAPGALSTRYQILDSHLAITTDQLQFNLWNWTSIDAGVGAGGAQALDPHGRDDSHLWMGDLTYHLKKMSDDWDNSIRTSYINYDQAARFTLLPPGSVIPIGEDGNINFAAPVGVSLFTDGLKGSPSGLIQDSQLDFISIYSGLDSHRLRLAIGTRRQSVDAYESKNFGPGVLDYQPLPAAVGGQLVNVSNSEYVFMADSSRSVKYISVQDEWNISKNLDLTTGVRYDDYSDFGSTTNPRIALVWAASEKLTAKILLGSAFRAPSFAELYYKNNPVSLGDKNLDAEKINSEELSFNYGVTENLQTTLTLFKYQAKKMIDFVTVSNDSTKIAKNINDQDGSGFEWEINYRPSKQLQLNVSYSKQDAKNAMNNTPIADAPGQQIKGNVTWLFAQDWTLACQGNWVADRERAVGDMRSNIDDYTLLDVAITRKNLFPELDLQLAVRNATDANAREPSSISIPDDYPLETRSFWFGLSYAFK
jgi:outer membrane receptor for ferrienterochelin and colicins